MNFTFTFIELFFISLWLLTPILLIMCAIIILLGLIASRFEGWRRFDGLYWTFITAFTVGYGDIRPLKRISRILSIFIALFGIMFTGMIVAVTINTATITIKNELGPDKMERVQQILRE